MRLARSLAGAAVALALTAATVWLSGLGWVVEPEADARLRLSWRAVGERVEECRKPSEEELASLPLHMRRSEICEGRVAPFRLALALDGAPRLDEEVRAAGVREDRPAYVYRELRVAPGEHAVAVRFGAEGPSAPAPAALDARVVFAPREVVLVTLDPDSGALVVRQAERTAASAGGGGASP